MIRQAATAPQSCPLAQYALAYEHLANAEFREALTWLERALAAEPTPLQFKLARLEALLGLGQYATLLAEEEHGATPRSPRVMLRRISLLAMNGQQAEARTEAARMFADLPPDVKEQMGEKITVTLKSLIAAASRD